jgi:anaerobic dimethyl sulfoxide reductase subunit B (iron-sulfur subunit)
MACMMRVLDIGPIDKLIDGTHQTKARHAGEQVVRQVQNMADPELTNPSIVFIAHSKGAVKKG